MSPAKIVAHAPILMVRNVPASVTYWVDKVGFTVGGLWGEPPEFAILDRDAAHLMLSQAPGDHTIVPHWRVRDKMWNAYFWVDDARAMYDEANLRGAIIDYELYEAPYGVLEFGIQDLDDQDIAFGQDLGKAE
jgi:hypothetical protein